MQLISNEKVISIMERTLNHVDPRLIDHGKRVAYLMYRMLIPQKKFSGRQLRDISILAMLHDVGAYKTEEIDRMVDFETVDVWEHSIYGSLFLKYFSPLKELAPVILYHHADCDEIKHLENPRQQLLAQLISICDRADVFALHNGDNDSFLKHIDANRGTKYRDDIVDIFLSSGVNIDTVFDEIDSDTEFNSVFHKTFLSDGEVSGYIKMIVYSIDFRSHQTVIHTATTVCIADILARFKGAGEDEIIKVGTGAMLHDIGKMGIPINILEYPGKLNDSDMEIMRTHVDITDRIIEGNVSDDVRKMAVNHHERLNGSGYPKRLLSRDISLFDRIVAIADVFSALCGARSYKSAFAKEKVIDILSDMSAKNLLDSEIVALTVENYDMIMKETKHRTRPVALAYNDINEEYVRIRNEIEGKFKSIHT